MNSHKLYNYEVSPPAEAWERIAQELDGVNEYRDISQKLQDLQVTAPALMWNKISADLDDQQLFNHIGKKLSDIAVAPPAGIWNKIESQLGQVLPAAHKPAPVIPLNTRIQKYAAAAVLVGLIITAGFFLVQRSSKDAEYISARVNDNSKNHQQALADLSNPAPAVKHTAPISHGSNVVNRPDSARMTAAGTEAVVAGAVTTSKGNMYTTAVEKNSEVDGRYIVLMTGDGNVVRMNKKVSGMADCIAGEDHSSECNDQIEEWQKEVASMPVLATPDNILGLLELATKQPVAAGL